MTDIDSKVGRSAVTPDDANPAKLFCISAQYIIDPTSETADIGSDIGCLFEAHLATIQALVDASEGVAHLDGLIFAALYQARQVSGLAREFVRRVNQMAHVQSATGTTAGVPVAAAQAIPVSATEEMGQALNDASLASNAIRTALDAIQVAVYSDLGAVEQGMYEAAIASTERLDRALSCGLEAGHATSPVLPGSAA